MANHVAAYLELGILSAYRDALLIFAELGWVDDDLKEKWLRMVGFRNILVRD